MNVHTVTDSESLRRGYQLYETRQQHKERPRCITCGGKLLLVRVRDGMQTCYKHDADDPTNNKPRKTSVRVGLEGPPAPRGTGLQLKRSRLDAGIKQYDLATEIGVGHGTLYRWETEKGAVPVRAARAIRKAIERLGK